MKVAHLNLQDYIYFGIEKKILEQANSAKSLGLDMDFIILNNEKESQTDNIVYKKFIYPKNNLKKKLMKRFFKFSIIDNTIDLSKYDAIIIRYPRPVSYDWKVFTDKYKNKLLTEHHAIALPETIQKITFGNILNFIQEYINSRFLKNHLIGLIGVTDEISIEESKTNSSLKTQTISNGINVADVTFTKYIPFNKKKLIMTMIASEYAPWQGLDRLLNSLLIYNNINKINIIINIVGQQISTSDSKLIQMINDTKENITINLLGIKRGKELDEIMARSTLAIGSLAIYRQKLKEACALKVREYLARGIPFVYTAIDPDIPRDCRFALELPNDETSIEFEDIINFAIQTSNISDLANEIRAFAYKTVDWKIKVNEMYTFIKKIKNK